LIPGDVMCTEGFVIDPLNTNGFKWHQLWSDKKTERNTVIFQAAINETGIMNGQATISSVDYARSRRMPFIKDKQDDFLSRFYTSNNSQLKLDSLYFENLDNDTLPLVQKFVFSAPLNNSGEYTFFSANMFSELKENPFISDTRYSDVFFGTNQNYTIIANFFIPAGYELEELPKNIRFSLEDKSLTVTRMVASSPNVLNARITLECKRPFYTPEEYPNLKEFYKKMYSLLDEQFVIKKKNS
jgi:hypothetical protein